MINVESLTRQIDTNVRVRCIDGQIIEGILDTIDDEEESGFNEMGISLATPDGHWIGVGFSEIDDVISI